VRFVASHLDTCSLRGRVLSDEYDAIAVPSGKMAGDMLELSGEVLMHEKVVHLFLRGAFNTSLLRLPELPGILKSEVSKYIPEALIRSDQ
jgi:hypothetical protein